MFKFVSELRQLEKESSNGAKIFLFSLRRTDEIFGFLVSKLPVEKD